MLRLEALGSLGLAQRQAVDGVDHQRCEGSTKCCLVLDTSLRMPPRARGTCIEFPGPCNQVPFAVRWLERHRQQSRWNCLWLCGELPYGSEALMPSPLVRSLLTDGRGHRWRSWAKAGHRRRTRGLCSSLAAVPEPGELDYRNGERASPWQLPRRAMGDYTRWDELGRESRLWLACRLPAR